MCVGWLVAFLPRLAATELEIILPAFCQLPLKEVEAVFRDPSVEIPDPTERAPISADCQSLLLFDSRQASS